MEKYAIYVPRLIQKKEKFAPGHRACIGCGEALAVRLAFKAMGNNVIVVNATGCMEIVRLAAALYFMASFPGFIPSLRTRRPSPRASRPAIRS